MSIKIGHASADENRKASGGAAGDQTGGEVCIREWYSSPWDAVLRPKNPEIAERSAKACEAACANKKIGYDQTSRNTLHIYAKLAGYDLARVEDECECDCSTLMHVCAIAGGAKLTYGINGMWTGNMAEGFTANGEYEVLREAKYLTSDAFLRRGDILLNSKSHTAMALGNGRQSEENAGEGKEGFAPTTGTVMLTPLPLLKMGSSGAAVWAMQTLLCAWGLELDCDGIFGADTEDKLVLFQDSLDLEPDGECGKMTWQKLINGGG